MRKNNIIILLVLLLLQFQSVWGQINNNGLDLSYKISQPKLPEVASLMKQIDYPANLYTGTVNIEIPLYVLEEGDIKIPITISYQPTGIKVKDVSGKVGIGWSLNVGPSLSRKINGIADDKAGIGLLYNTKWRNRQDSSIPWWFDEYLYNGSADESSDTFYYKLLNKSGKFYFTRDILAVNPGPAQLVLQPYEPVKIEPDWGYGFTITDDEGFFYDFGGAYDYSYTNAAGEDCVSAWKIQRIASPVHNNRVDFSYNAVRRASFLPMSIDRIIVEEYQFPINEQINLPTPYMSSVINAGQDNYTIWRDQNNIHNARLEAYLNTMPNYRSGASVTYMDEQFLQKIESKYIRIEFEYASNNECKQIRITDKKTNTIIRTIDFTLSNCHPYLPSTTFEQRRKLDSVTIKGCDGAFPEKYSFTYNLPEQLPENNNTSKDTDHWGYYNRANNSPTASAVPKQQISITLWPRELSQDRVLLEIGAANKEPNPDAMKIGILKTITYPTGRKTEFGYEAHEYIDATTHQKKYAGGLRIASVSEKDVNGILQLYTVYKYGETENGAGNIVQPVSLDDYSYEKLYFSSTDPGSPFASYVVARARYFQSEPLVNLFNENGSSVTYDCITEYKNQGANVLCKTVYRYPIPVQIWSPTNRLQGTTMVFDLDRGWSEGKLLSKTEYRYFQGNYYMARKTTNEYETYKYSTFNIGRNYLYIELRGYDEIDATNIRNSGFYGTSPYLNLYGVTSDRYGYMSGYRTVETGCMRQTKETIRTWDGALTWGDAEGLSYVNWDETKCITQERTYKYNNLNHMYASEIIESASDGTTRKQRYLYPQDTTYTTSAYEAGRNGLIQAHRLNTMLEEHVQTGSKKWIKKNLYALSYGIPGLSKITSNTGLNNSDEDRIIISLYDKNGNPVCINQNGIDKVYIWGYGGLYPIAEIVGLDKDTFVQTLTASPICSNIDNLATSVDENDISGLRAVFSYYYPVTTYSYNPVYGITSVTDPAGITTYYDYDDFGRLKETYIYKDNIVSPANKQVVQQYDYHYQNQ